ncbi:RNA polymerase factor sigma-54 [Planctomycetota bacterium]
MNRERNLNIDLSHRLEQKLALTPKLVQSLEILQLPVLELSTLIKQELEENPTIELKEEPQPGEETKPQATTSEEDKTSLLKILDEGRGEPTRGTGGTWRAGSVDAKLDAMQNTPDQATSLQDYLYQQLVVIKTSAKKLTIGRNIIYNTDNHGLLKTSLEEIALISQSNAEETHAVLKIIQQFDPPGVGARNLKEQLLLQLDETNPDFELKRMLITNHLEDIHQNRIPELATRFGMSIDELKMVLKEIKALQFRPAYEFSKEKTFYVTPDVVIEEIDNKYEIKLNDTYFPKLTISNHYRNILNDSSANAQLKNFVLHKIERAQNIISAIYLRQNTLRRITQKIIDLQKDFLKNGPTYLKPLAMSKVAEHLKIHISTVSRSIARKYIQTPQGIYTMRFFFARGTENMQGDTKAKHHSLDALKELINQEDKQHPFSDEALCQTLKQKGFNIARRTVAQYRESLNIQTAQQRKKH